jgi:hypothetical protein
MNVFIANWIYIIDISAKRQLHDDNLTGLSAECGDS